MVERLAVAEGEPLRALAAVVATASEAALVGVEARLRQPLAVGYVAARTSMPERMQRLTLQTLLPPLLAPPVSADPHTPDVSERRQRGERERDNRDNGR